MTILLAKKCIIYQQNHVNAMRKHLYMAEIIQCCHVSHVIDKRQKLFKTRNRKKMAGILNIICKKVGYNCAMDVDCTNVNYS